MSDNDTYDRLIGLLDENGCRTASSPTSPKATPIR